VLRGEFLQWTHYRNLAICDYPPLYHRPLVGLTRQSLVIRCLLVPCARILSRGKSLLGHGQAKSLTYERAEPVGSRLSCAETGVCSSRRSHKEGYQIILLKFINFVPQGTLINPHPNKAIENRFILSMLLTFAILIAEVIGGFWTGSLALLSDAAHVLMDVFVLGLSYLALRLSSMPADDRHTYGFHRLEVLAALINGVTLGAIAIEIFSEAWQRWFHLQPVKSAEMLVIAVIGLVVNLVVAFVFGGHEHEHDHEGEDGAEAHEEAEDLNVRSTLLHVIGDAVSSVGVIVAAGVIWFTGWEWVDPLMSVFIGIIIVLSSWRVLKSSLHILVEGVPEHLSVDKIGASIGGVPGVLDVHDLHVWSICSGHVALSAHVITADQTIADSNGIMAELKARLRQFGIEHTTIQFECAACGQGSDLSVASSTSSSQIASL